MIEVRQARYFVAVAEELHFGRAAERLRMSQPPLSQAIQQLERQIEAQLLERTSRTVSLTEAGSVLLRHCYTLLAAAERAQTATAQAQSGRLGTLTLGAVTSAFADPLPAVLGRFRTDRPHVELRAHEVGTREGAQAVLDMKLDIAVIRYSGADPRLGAQVLRRDHLVAALPSNRKHSTGGTVALSALGDEPWVWIPRAVSPGYHDELVTACRQAGFSPQVHHHATSISAQLAMVACGLGVALVPHTAGVPLTRVQYVPLRDPFSLVELAVVHRASDPEPLVRHFVRCALRQGPTRTTRGAGGEKP
jgi:DNA-binding transcriptional LysR family regulator